MPPVPVLALAVPAWMSPPATLLTEPTRAALSALAHAAFAPPPKHTLPCVDKIPLCSVTAPGVSNTTSPPCACKPAAAAPDTVAGPTTIPPLPAVSDIFPPLEVIGLPPLAPPVVIALAAPVPSSTTAPVERAPGNVMLPPALTLREPRPFVPLRPFCDSKNVTSPAAALTVTGPLVSNCPPSGSPTPAPTAVGATSTLCEALSDMAPVALLLEFATYRKPVLSNVMLPPVASRLMELWLVMTGLLMKMLPAVKDTEPEAALPVSGR